MWIARDKSGVLSLYNEKPEKGYSLWIAYKDDRWVEIDKDLFPEVKWEDEQPTEVEVIIKRKENK